MEIRHTGAAALAATDHSVEFGETFLLPTVNIIRQRISGLLGEQGAAIAGGEIGQAKAFGAIPSAIAGGFGSFQGLGGKF